MALSKIIKGYSNLVSDKLGITKESENIREKLKICLECDSKEKSLVGINTCKECGCPIEALIRGKECPKNKWK